MDITQQHTDVQLEYIAVGGNRQPSAADWQGDVLAYGAGNNVALWQADGVKTLLTGHTGSVNAVRILKSYILSGSSDKTVKIWQGTKEFATIRHEASINTIAVLGDIFATGSADGIVKLWRLHSTVEELQTIVLKPKFLPLATALVRLDDSILLAIGGTTSSIHIYAGLVGKVSLQAVLTGHEGWIRSLDFDDKSGEILLASTSQDRFIRLWKVKQAATENLSNKVYKIQDGWVLSYDALLVGHEDWIYTARWAPHESTLLSASADNSLALWRKDNSGLWICETRLGEISSLKGSTTATGSTGGFWVGLWSPDGQSVVSLGRTGSWRKWTFDGSWTQQTSISGHIREVQSVSWSPDGSYLLSTSTDQTTRLWAKSKHSWHEIARPQIHGYDLNCVAAVNNNQFVSGADEKLLRVFNKPRATERLLSLLCGKEAESDLPEAANIPVLGLSNKVTEETIDLDEIPVEDILARQTLWPEHEKLYGHGYEISALAVNHAGSLIATACKASTLDHAVIRLYETREWRELKPSLTAHTLTATSLSFSKDDQYLLSVGRDRQWALFVKAGSTYTPFTANLKGHSRMILGCTWASDSIFATAGRDKMVKIWEINTEVKQISTITATSPVTAVAFSGSGRKLLYGTDEGALVLAESTDGWHTIHEERISVTPSATITSIAWQPGDNLFAVGSEDTALRLYRLYAT